MNPNRLDRETSSYLRSAAQQPVAWYPWSAEAFEQARREDKPILLDIGAVWCHWCHVMDRESYEDPELARLINERFVPIKVDRDERPDIDRRYQEAVGAISGQGGWPLTAFLTPDARVFYGGTYFPPDDRYGRPGFGSLLVQLANFYRDNRERALQAAETLHKELEAHNRQVTPGKLYPLNIDNAVDQMVASFDGRYGGFGSAPKFPHPATLELLIARFVATRQPDLDTVIRRTLRGMAQGGVCDQVGGGFHRYSVDERWIVPHFEKMAYDNAELLKNYVDGYRLTGEPRFLEVAEGILAYVDTVLSDRERGGFYASQDADISLEDDGDHFTWTVEEARVVLEEQEFAVLSRHYNIYPKGEMHHDIARNVLFIDMSPEEIAGQLKLEVEEVQRLIAVGRKKLLDARQQRPIPFVDKTLYTNWNGMFITAYLRAFKALKKEGCRDFALRTMERLLAEAYDPTGGFYHALLDGQARHPGLLEDQVQMAWSLLEAYEVTAELRYLQTARHLVSVLLRDYWDPEGHGFFDRTAQPDAPGLLGSRFKPFQDSPTPAANSVAALVLDRLAYLTGEESYRERAEQTLTSFAETSKRYGLFAATYFLALDYHLNKPLQVVIVGSPRDSRTDTLFAEALGSWRPHKLVRRFNPEGEDPQTLPPAVQGMLASYRPEHGARAFVCGADACAPPTGDVREMGQLIESFGLKAPV